MTEIIVTIEDNALPIIQASLDEYNDYLRRATMPQVTMAQFINKNIVDRFNVSPESIAARERAAQRDIIVSKIDAVKTEQLKAIETAVDEAIGKIADPMP